MSQWRVLFANLRSKITVQIIRAAAGNDAPVADDTEIPQMWESGSSMPDDDGVLLERKRSELHDAMESYFKIAFPGVLVTTDWLLIAENVMADEEETRMLHPAVSRHMSSWKVLGMTAAAVKHFSGATY